MRNSSATHRDRSLALGFVSDHGVERGTPATNRCAVLAMAQWLNDWKDDSAASFRFRIFLYSALCEASVKGREA